MEPLVARAGMAGNRELSADMSLRCLLLSTLYLVSNECPVCLASIALLRLLLLFPSLSLIRADSLSDNKTHNMFSQYLLERQFSSLGCRPREYAGMGFIQTPLDCESYVYDQHVTALHWRRVVEPAGAIEQSRSTCNQFPGNQAGFWLSSFRSAKTLFTMESSNQSSPICLS